MLFAMDATQRRAAGSVDERASSIARSFQAHASSVGSTIPSMCAASTASASSPVARASSQAPTERVAAAALATCGVRDAPTLEQETDAAAASSGRERRFCVVERPVGVVEAALESLRAGELGQRLGQDAARRRPARVRRRRRNRCSLPAGSSKSQSASSSASSATELQRRRRSRTPGGRPRPAAAPRSRRESRRSRRRACRPSRRCAEHR